jgi:prephenate dehydrogenase
MGKLTIVGLGLIGGSIGLALKRAEPENTEICGFDRDREVMIRAHKHGVVDTIAPTLEEAVADATMVIVSTPIVTVRRVFREMAPYLREGVVVTDTASTKGEVLRWASVELPKTVYFVGGHPMAGKENQGLHYAEETLFDGRPYIIVPSVESIPGAVNAVVGFAEALGAEPMFLDADEHDAYAAGISHLPLVTSLALFNLIRSSNAWPELAGVSGPAFRDLTRLASGEPEMAHDIFLTNREQVLHWLNRYIGELHRLADMIDAKEDTESLYKTLTDAQIERDKFLEKLPERESPVKWVELTSPTNSFITMLTGTLIQERAKELTSYLEEQNRESDEVDRLRRRRKSLDDMDD